jgi:FKBP12-rapamycin complex-associated protein
LNVLCIILSGHPYRAPGDPRHKDRERERAISGSSSSLRENEPSKDVATIILALETLAEFEYSGFMLHELIRDWVVTYTDDDNPDVRKAAAKATCAILQKDPILLQTSKQALEVVDQILGRLLSVAISDPDPSIRELVLKYTGEEFDRHLVQADNLRALFLAINDEVFSVRMIAMKHVGRLVDKNPAYVIPQLRRTLIQILTEIEYSNVSRNKEEAAKLLSMLISSSQYYVKPYVESILKALLPKATDPSPGVSASVLSAIGHLASIGCEALVPYLRQLMPIILDGLNDLSSNIKREAALVTLGQLCSNTGYVIAPYLEYPNLLHSLIKILKSEQSVTLRRETQRVLGVLGALDPYRQVRGSEMDEAEDNLSDVSLMLTISPSSEEYLPSVAINALMKILKDPTLSAYHTPAIQAFMYIFKTLGMKCVPFLPQIMPVFLGVMRQVPPAVLEFHFQQLGNLVSIVKHNIRNYLADIFSLIRDFWNPNSSLQTTILSLVEAIAQVMENEFKVYLPNLLTHMLQICEADVQEKRSSALKVLHVLVVFGASLQEYLHLVVPVLCRLLERSEAPQNIRRAVIESIGKMGRRVNFTDHSSRIIHSLVRVLAGPFSDIKSAAMDTLCILVIQLGNRYTIFSETVNRILERQRLQHANYSGLMHNLYTGSPLPSITDLFGEERDDTKSHEAAAVDTGMIKKLTVSQQHLKRAWETSQRSTREDWLEWIRRLSVELLQQSPSHALRACASLASVYHPLARELFNAAFVSCWTELYDQNQDELMQSIESALRSSNIPPEILNTLLNLAEFMEHDDKTLPIDARTLGTYAAKCHAYAKALHYREAEFINNQSTQMVESLISINNQLQQPDTAIGILTYAQQKLNFELKESWYEKLLRWEDALAAYERKQIENPKSFELTLGRMRCLHELGEWETLSKLCTEKWDFADDDQRRAIAPLAASAAWGMSEWENMDNYIVYMKQPSPNRAFFRAIHLIHRNDFEPAQELINKTRALLDTELSAVLSESYSRAYAYLSNFVLMCVG